jgi:GTPase SAR1 family protein
MSFLKRLVSSEDKKPEIIKLNIGIVGMPNVGKTSLVLKYTRKIFDPRRIATDEVDITLKWIEMQTYENDSRGNIIAKNVQLTLNDRAGANEICNSCGEYDGFIVVYSPDNPVTFNYVAKFVEKIFGLKHWNTGKNKLSENRPKYPCIIVQNKSDLKIRNEFAYNSICTEYNIEHFITSAKDGTNVDEMFHRLAQLIYSNNLYAESLNHVKKKQSRVSLEKRSSSLQSLDSKTKRRSLGDIKKSSSILNMSETHPSELVSDLVLITPKQSSSFFKFKKNPSKK